MTRPDWKGDPEIEREDRDDALADRDCPSMIDLEDWERDALAQVPRRTIDDLAAGNERSLISAIARSLRGGARS